MTSAIIAVLALGALLIFGLLIALELPTVLAQRRAERDAFDFAEKHWRKKGLAVDPPWRRKSSAIAFAVLALGLSGCGSLQPKIDDSAKALIREQAITAIKVRGDFSSGLALGDLAIKSRINRLSAQISAAETFVGEDLDGDGRIGEGQ